MATLEQWRQWSFGRRGRFTDWRRLTEATVSDCPARPGVYLLARPSAHDPERPRPIGRLLAEDPHGIIDAGEAGSLRDRIHILRCCITAPGTRGHMAGWRLGQLRLLEKFGCAPDDLLVSWHVVADKKEAYEWEGWLLRVYFELFGELPPLNYKFNWSAFAEE